MVIFSEHGLIKAHLILMLGLVASLLMYKVCKRMIHVAKLDLDLIIHRLQQIFELWEAKFIPFEVEWELLLQILWQLCKRHSCFGSSLRLSQYLDDGLFDLLQFSLPLH